MKSKFKVLLLTMIIVSSCISCTFAQAGRIIGGAMGMVMDSGVVLGNSAAGKALKRAITNRTPKEPKAPKTTTKDIKVNTAKTINLKNTNKK